jgi:hypothetical protein
MNPAHFQFVTTPPFHGRYSLALLFELLDRFDVKHRDMILGSAYLCFTLPKEDGCSPETHREERYESFKTVFSATVLQDSTEEEAKSKEAYAVYGLVSYVLVQAMSSSQSDVYGQSRASNQTSLKQCEEARQSDGSSRQRAMEWSEKAIKQMERLYAVNFARTLAYRRFCEEVVRPLLANEMTTS